MRHFLFFVAVAAVLGSFTARGESVADGERLLERLAAEPANERSELRGNPLADEVTRYFEGVLTASPGLLARPELASLAARMVTRPCFARYTGGELLDRLFERHAGIFAGYGYFSGGRREAQISEDELARRRALAFLAALREVPLERLGAFLNIGQAFGINWDFGSPPQLAHDTTSPQTFELVTAVYSEMLTNAAFRTRPAGADAAYAFDNLQSGLGGGLEALSRARSDFPAPLWRSLVYAAERAIEEELAKTDVASVLHQRLRGSLLLVARLAPIRALRHWNGYHERFFSRSRDEYGRSLALVSRIAPATFTRWLRAVAASGTGAEIVSVLFSSQADPRSAGGRLIGNALEQLAARPMPPGVSLVVAPAPLPPTASSAVEGASTILRTFLAEQRDSRQRTATFQRRPERRGNWFAPGENEYFAFALLDALAPETGRAFETEYRAHYRITVDNAEAWDAPDASTPALLAEANALRGTYQSATYEAQQTENYQAIRESEAALRFRGTLKAIREELAATDCAIDAASPSAIGPIP